VRNLLKTRRVCGRCGNLLHTGGQGGVIWGVPNEKFADRTDRMQQTEAAGGEQPLVSSVFWVGLKSPEERK
jgi:hypothetical protein